MYETYDTRFGAIRREFLGETAAPDLKKGVTLDRLEVAFASLDTSKPLQISANGKVLVTAHKLTGFEVKSKGHGNSSLSIKYDDANGRSYSPNFSVSSNARIRAIEAPAITVKSKTAINPKLNGAEVTSSQKIDGVNKSLLVTIQKYLAQAGNCPANEVQRIRNPHNCSNQPLIITHTPTKGEPRTIVIESLDKAVTLDDSRIKLTEKSGAEEIIELNLGGSLEIKKASSEEIAPLIKAKKEKAEAEKLKAEARKTELFAEVLNTDFNLQAGSEAENLVAKLNSPEFRGVRIKMSHYRGGPREDEFDFDQVQYFPIAGIRFYKNSNLVAYCYCDGGKVRFELAKSQ